MHPLETEEDLNFDAEKVLNSKQKPTYDELRRLARYFHFNMPENPYYREKIPYKTIIAVTVLFIIGTIFLTIFTMKMLEDGDFKKHYEFMLLGLITFIPGSYHVVIAFMACRGVKDWSYRDVAVFDDDHLDVDD